MNELENVNVVLLNFSASHKSHAREISLFACDISNEVFKRQVVWSVSMTGPIVRFKPKRQHGAVVKIVTRNREDYFVNEE